MNQTFDSLTISQVIGLRTELKRLQINEFFGFYYKDLEKISENNFKANVMKDLYQKMDNMVFFDLDEYKESEIKWWQDGF